MDWNKGYGASYYMTLVDPVTWRDLERIDIVSGNINRSSSGLRESADIGCIDYEGGSDKWIRVWMDAEQDGSSEHVALFTGLASTPEKIIDGPVYEMTLQCYSVLKPAQDILLPIGWYAAKGFIGSEVISSLLSVCPAKVVIEEESPRLSDHIIAEQGETNLTMIERLLEMLNWRLWIEGDGTIFAGPGPVTESALYSEMKNDSIEPKVTVKHDWFGCPNVLRVSTEDSSVTVVDTDPESILSTVSRGREIWAEESDAKLGDNESLQTYASRRLRELQATSKIISYDRCYNPEVHVTDIVRLHYPAQKLDGIFVVESQKVRLDHCATTSEEVKQVQ